MTPKNIANRIKNEYDKRKPDMHEGLELITNPIIKALIDSMSLVIYDEIQKDKNKRNKK